MEALKVISKVNSVLTIQYIQTSTENQYFERKQVGDTKVQPSKISNELIAMLNADGGVLILGITNDGEIVGINSLSEEEKNRYRKICHDLIQPVANIYLEEITLDDGKILFIYHVESELERVFSRKDNEAVYIRIADACKGPLDREQVRKLEYDKSIRKFEDEKVNDFNVADLNLDTLNSYKLKINFQGTPIELLIKRNLAVKDCENILFKKSAILLFSQNPDKYIPNSLVRYVRYNGIFQDVGADHNVIKDERFEDCIPVLIEKLEIFLSNSLRDYYFLDIKSGKFNKVSEYPKEAWLEGIVNALTHRSYNISGNPVYIKHFDDRLEISNSGPLPAQVTVENIREERYSRNPRVARVLYDMGYVRELNEGVRRIYESMEESMLTKPEYIDKNNIVTLVLRNNITLHKKTISQKTMNNISNLWNSFGEIEKGIIRYLFINGEAKLGDLIANLESTDKTIRSYLKKLINAQVLVKDTARKRDLNAPYLFLDI